jgi:hypothetical protein
MHNKTRFVLPLIQVVVAIVLTTSNFLRPDTIGRPSWTAPDTQFCDALNAPAALVRFFLLRIADRIFPRYYPVEFVLETIIYFALVGLLWYAVSVEIDAKGQSILAPATRARGTTDVLAMLFGIKLAVNRGSSARCLRRRQRPFCVSGITQVQYRSSNAAF